MGTSIYSGALCAIQLFYRFHGGAPQTKPSSEIFRTSALHSAFRTMFFSVGNFLASDDLGQLAETARTIEEVYSMDSRNTPSLLKSSAVRGHSCFRSRIGLSNLCFFPKACGIRTTWSRILLPLMSSRTVHMLDGARAGYSHPVA